MSAFQAEGFFCSLTQGVALGWYVKRIQRIQAVKTEIVCKCKKVLCQQLFFFGTKTGPVDLELKC